MSHILLASRSPRRKQLLTGAGFDVRVRAADIQERSLHTRADAIAQDLALQKGVAVMQTYAEEAQEAAWTVAADTIVWCQDGTILGKPKDREHAQWMLTTLMGRAHFVSTAFALFQKNEAPVHIETVTSKVFMEPLPATSLAAYLDTDEPWDKAGAYGIQGLAGTFISRIEGSWHAVVGLPIYHMLRAAKSSGLIHHMPWEKLK